MNLLTNPYDEYIAITVLVGVAAFIAGGLVGYWIRAQKDESHIRMLRDTMSTQARVIARLDKRPRKTQEVQDTRRLIQR
jgi:hypothetical protein